MLGGFCMSYAILDTNNISLVETFTKRQFALFASRLRYKFEEKHPHISIDQFINEFYLHYFISGKKTFLDFDSYNARWKTFRKPQHLAIIELIKFNKKEQVWSRYRFITPEELYLNFTSDLWKQEKKKYKTHFFYFKHGNDYLDKKPVLNTHKIRQGRKHNSYLSFRVRAHGEKYYQRASDWRYDVSLNQPASRSHHGQISSYDSWDYWDDSCQSNKPNWKVCTKDKYQWEHNVRNHTPKNVYVDTKTKAQIKQDYYNEFDKLSID